ncbi:hypothetical protein R1flu_026769 [Riccia fluitans]|uniref:Uncharacterized protein n=1 Tax=Riccia fluitans TaxID=41844 RepID=A0ABD1XGY3_9MARC
MENQYLKFSVFVRSKVFKQKERNLQAEIGILTTGQKLAEMTMRAEAARRQHEMDGSVKGVTRAAVEALTVFVDQHSAIIFHQLQRLAEASCSGGLQVGTLWTAPEIQRAASDDGHKRCNLGWKNFWYSYSSRKTRGEHKHRKTQIHGNEERSATS